MGHINWSTIRRKTIARFALKSFNDWIFNLAGLLAYNFLLATVPLFLLLIGGVGFALQKLSPNTKGQLTNSLASIFPKQVSSGLIAGVTTDLEQSSGVLLIVGLIAAFFFGSRLFIRIEDAFTIIYRRKPRSILGQNAMALGMTLLFLALMPIMLLAAAVPSLLANRIIQDIWHVPLPGAIGQAAGFLGAYLAAFLWLLIIYMFMPRTHVPFRHSWPGAALAALLFIIYELVFPWFASALLRPGKYGANAGFLLLLLAFFYYFAFLLLLGAEFNSWLEGHRETMADVPTMLHEAIIYGQLPQVSSDHLPVISNGASNIAPPPDDTPAEAASSPPEVKSA
jgi:membrane protein